MTLRENRFFKILLIYLPFTVAFLAQSDPQLSYLIAWLGSFFIFYLTFKGKVTCFPGDLPLEQQLLRPIFLMHLIYAGYLSSSSIFYYLDSMGYKYFTFVGDPKSIDGTALLEIAECQRYYSLAHAALVHGMVAFMSQKVEPKYELKTISFSTLLLRVALICWPLGYVLSKAGGLSQFSEQVKDLAFVGGTISLAFAIREKKTIVVLVGIGLFALNFINALSSGFKEPIIISVLLLGIFLIPVLGRKTYLIFGVAFIVLFTVLPTFIGAFRSAVFSGEVTVEQARSEGLNAVFNNKNLKEDLENDNWAFLTNRLSEINMFRKYTHSTPEDIPFYGFQLAIQGVEVIVPRVLWPGKPVTEYLVMERVYNAGVVSRSSNVSAKPAFVVDGYLSGGYIGIWLSLFAFGAAAQLIANRAERLFGGYVLGTAVMFTGLFQIFWRGNSFEFVFNSVFWSFVTMLLIFSLLKKLGFLVQK